MTKYQLPDDLYTYQKEDYKKLLSEGNWLNFSEMGVGKTPEALAVVEEGKYGCILILCPNSLRLEWERQIVDWVGDDLVAVSSPYSYEKLNPIVFSLTNGKRYKVLNYEALRNDQFLEILSCIPFDIIIMDEIHKLRNSTTKQVKGAWKLANAHPNAKILGLSGSPIMNNPGDLYPILAIVKPDRYPRTNSACKQFQYYYGAWAVGRFGAYQYGTMHMDRLKAETAPFVIRRLKKDVLPFLPEKYYRRTLLEMGPEQRKVYDQMENELKILLDTGEPLWAPSVLAALTRLRQINLDPRILGVSCPSAKTEFIVDTVESVLEGKDSKEGGFLDSSKEKMVIFSCFERYVDLLSSDFSDIPHVVISGKIPADERINQVKKFQNDPNIKLCIGTIHTAGEGITLTAASNCIMADRWWNNPVCGQAIDRLHRIGQKNAVQVIFPICSRSVDQHLDRVLEMKDRLSSEYFNESSVTRKVLEETYRNG